MNKTQISGTQAVILLFLSRIFSLLTFAPQGKESIDGSISLAAAVLAVGAQLLVFFPAFLLMRRYPGRSLTDMGTLILGKWGGGLLSFLTWISALIFCASAASEFELFLTTAAYNGAPRCLFTILFLLAVAYGVFVGLESFSRFGLFVLVVFAASLLLISSSLLGEYNLLHVISPLYYGWTPLLQTTYSLISKNFEAVIFLLLLPYLKKEKGGERAYLGWVLFYGAVSVWMIFASLTTLGEYGNTRIYPFYTMASIAEASFFERMDLLHMGVWSFVGFCKGCVFLFAANECLKNFARGKAVKYRLGINTVLLLILSLFLTSNLAALRQLQQFLGTGIPALVLFLGAPILLLLAGCLKHRKERIPHEA